MKAVLALLLGVAASYNLKQEFTFEDLKEVDPLLLLPEWANEFGKTYDNIVDNLYKITSANSQDLGYKFALNQFSDLPPEQFTLYDEEGHCFKPGETTDLTEQEIE